MSNDVVNGDVNGITNYSSNFMGTYGDVLDTGLSGRNSSPMDSSVSNEGRCGGVNMSDGNEQIVKRRKSVEPVRVDCNGKTIRRCNRNLNSIGQTLFIKLVGTFMKGQQQSRGCVDYMVYTLINNNFDAIEKLIHKELSKVKNGKELLKKLPYIQEYLRYFYYTHIGTDDDYFHSVYHGPYGKLLTEGTMRAACIECQKPFQFFSTIRSNIPYSKEVRP